MSINSTPPILYLTDHKWSHMVDWSQIQTTAFCRSMLLADSVRDKIHLYKLKNWLILLAIFISHKKVSNILFFLADWSWWMLYWLVDLICYKTIFIKINTEETFLPFTIITNKDYFPRKNDYKLNFQKFTVAVYLWSWGHWCQLRWAASAGKQNKKLSWCWQQARRV